MTLGEIQRELTRTYGSNRIVTLIVRDPKTNTVEIITAEEGLSAVAEIVERERSR